MRTAERSKNNSELSVFTKTAAVTFSDLVLQPANALRDAEIFDALSQHPNSRTDCISAILAAAYGISQETAISMPVLERHAALLQLAISFGSWPAWFVKDCEECSEVLDVRIARDEFVYGAAAATKGFPYFDVTVAGDSQRFMIPNGTHERYLETINQDQSNELLQLCQESDLFLDPIFWASAFEEELAKYSPTVITVLQFECPKCHDQTGYWFDPIDWINRHAAGCFHEVHQLALAYGWQEQHILEMSTTRRQTYLKILADQV